MLRHVEKAIAAARERILAAEKYLWAHPETGFREKASCAYMKKQFEELGYTVTEQSDITGFYTVVDTGREGPEVLVLSELDSVVCPAHPDADKETGAVHACGHHAQGAAMVGIAAALRDPAVLARLSGRVRLCVVPAEEMLEIGYRDELCRQGVIRYLNGKDEFLARGCFDGADMALMVHLGPSLNVHDMIGFIAKIVTFRGKAAHAGGAPWNGCNALYAATAGLNAINALRETFRESDYIRVHPIITHGGDAVNVIPAEVTMEMYVRGATFGAIRSVSEKIDRALAGAALSMGAEVHIATRPGYAPLVNDAGMTRVAADAAALAMPDVPFSVFDRPSTGSTDMGDLSCVMPVVHGYCPGVTGSGHGSDYFVTDPETACVRNAAWQVTMLDLLLGDGAERAKAVLANYRAPYADKEAFLAEQDGFRTDRDVITYRPDGHVDVDLA